MLFAGVAAPGACRHARERDAMSRSAVCMLVAALLVAAGCDHTTQPKPPSPDQITVTSNKTHYAPQEPILVTVSNTGGSPVWFWSYDCLPSYEKQLSGAWEPEPIIVCPAGWTYYEIDPGQSREFTWDHLSLGEYRALVYKYDSPGCAAEDLCDMKQPDVHRSMPFNVD
jgi:hypothetical protein